jgi:hypothetical protein
MSRLSRPESCRRGALELDGDALSDVDDECSFDKTSALMTHPAINPPAETMNVQQLPHAKAPKAQRFSIQRYLKWH